MAILRPYAEGRFGRNEAQKRAFYDTALSRKRNLRRDFEAFYPDVLGKKDFRFDDALDALAKGKLGPADQELLEEVRSLGWQGKTMPFDEGDIEDQNALIFVETFQGRQRTVAKMKVRPEAEEKLLAVLREAGVEMAPARVGHAEARDDAEWVVNRLVENDVRSLPEDLLAYHQSTLSPYRGMRGAVVETDHYVSAKACTKSVLERIADGGIT